MRTVKVNLGEKAYQVMIWPGMLRFSGSLLAGMGLCDKAVIISDARVGPLYAPTVKEALAEADIEACYIEVPVGEEEKSLERAAAIYDQLTDFYAERNTPVLALGGGVIGDLAGFVAATYMRGVPLIQLPTTLLSQGDSSIGGKVAVNHGRLKNKIGAFYHPRITISDTDTLKSLSPRELSNGLSEIIKHGIILDAEFFEYLESNISRIRGLDDEALGETVTRSAGIKAGVVEQDELDLGLRNILNFGHTIGHALEAVSELTLWHGEAVAIGIQVEADISVKTGRLKASERDRITEIIRQAGLPVAMPRLDRDKLLQAMKHDKKNIGGKVKFVLPQSIGQVVVTDEVKTDVIAAALEEALPPAEE